MLFVEIPLHRFRSLQAEALVQRDRANVVGVAFDLDVDPLRIGLQLPDQLVQPRLRFLRQVLPAELEVALILAQRHLVDQAAG